MIAKRNSRPAARTYAVVATLAVMLALGSGCFNTYRFTPTEFKKLQSTLKVPQTVVSKKGRQVVVDGCSHTTRGKTVTLKQLAHSSQLLSRGVLPSRRLRARELEERR